MTSEQAGDPPTRPADRNAIAPRFALLVAAGLVALVVLHAVLNRGIPAPQIHADEGGYLGDARFIASGYGRSGVGYYAGYSLFLVPAAWLTRVVAPVVRSKR